MKGLRGNHGDEEGYDYHDDDEGDDDDGDDDDDDDDDDDNDVVVDDNDVVDDDNDVVDDDDDHDDMTMITIMICFPLFFLQLHVFQNGEVWTETIQPNCHQTLKLLCPLRCLFPDSFADQVLSSCHLFKHMLMVEGKSEGFSNFGKCMYILTCVDVVHGLLYVWHWISISLHPCIFTHLWAGMYRYIGGVEDADW